MPSTITAYYTFSPATKARSSEANTNFSNHRGTLVPIEENTAAASNNAHAIGQVDHRWTTFYGGTVDLRGMTTTSNLVIRNDTALTLGAAELLISSTTLGNFGFGQMGFAGVTSTEYTKFQYQSGGGTLDLLMGSSTLGTWTTNGLKHRTKAPLEFTTASAAIGTSLLIGLTTVSFNLDTTASVTFTSARLNTKGGGLVKVELMNAINYLVGSASVTCWGEFLLYRGTTTTSMTLLSANTFGRPATNLPFADTVGSYPPGGFIDTTYTAGEVVYELRLRGKKTNVNGSIQLTGNVFLQEL